MLRKLLIYSINRTTEAVKLGEKGARERAGDLTRYAVDDDRSTGFLERQRRRPREPVTVDRVRIENSSRLGFADDFDGNTSYTITARHQLLPVNRLGGEWENAYQLGTANVFSSVLCQPLEPGVKWFAAPAVELRRELVDLWFDGTPFVQSGAPSSAPTRRSGRCSWATAGPTIGIASTWWSGTGSRRDSPGARTRARARQQRQRQWQSSAFHP